MNILDRTKDAWRAGTAIIQGKATSQDIFRTGYGGDAVATPERNDEEYLKTYASSSWVYSAVSAIAEDVSRFKPRLYKTLDGERVAEIKSHPFLDFLRRVNDHMTWGDFCEAWSISYDLSGEFPIYLDRPAPNRPPTQMWPLRNDWLKVKGDARNLVTGYAYGVQQGGVPRFIDFEPWEIILHKRYNPMDMRRGQSPLRAAAYAVDTDHFAANHVRNFLYNRAMPAVGLSTDKELKEPQIKELVNSWRAKFQGPNKAGGVVVLHSGLKAESLASSFADLQLVDMRIFTRDEILAIYKMPRTIIGITDDVNRANAEATDYVYGSRVILPRYERMAGILQEFMLPMWPGTDGMEIGFDSPVPEDKLFTLQYHTAAVDKWETANEIRIANRKPELEGADDLLRPIGLIPMDQVATPPEAVVPADGAKGVEKGVHKKGLNDATKSVYAKQYNALFNRETKRWKVGVRKIFKQLRKDTMARLEKLPEAKLAQGVRTKVFDELLPDKAKLAASFEIFGKEAMNSTISAAAKEVLQLLGADARFSNENGRVLHFINNHSKKFADGVADHTMNMFKVQLANSIDSGESIPELQERLGRMFDGMEDYRTERIARTETLGATNFSTYEVYNQNGVEQKEWLSTEDDRTRDDHKAENIEVKVVGVDQPFYVGGEYLMYPGDPTASPSNVVNCRCTMVPVIN